MSRKEKYLNFRAEIIFFYKRYQKILLVLACESNVTKFRIPKSNEEAELLPNFQGKRYYLQRSEKVQNDVI